MYIELVIELFKTARYPVFLIDFMLGCFFFNIFAIFESSQATFAML